VFLQKWHLRQFGPVKKSEKTVQNRQKTAKTVKKPLKTDRKTSCPS
jgi:hypothetical protein